MESSCIQQHSFYLTRKVQLLWRVHIRCLIFSFLQTDFHWIHKMYILTDIPKNGGDDKNKNVERNPSNILPGNGQINRICNRYVAFLPLSHSVPTRWVLHLAALQPVRSPRCLPPVCGRQCAFREHHGPGPRHHGLEKHPEGVLHTWHHHGHRTSAAGPRHVGGKNSCEGFYMWTICTHFIHITVCVLG